MSTIYSLVCWGGKDGKTVTMTIASPCVVSLANHGLRDGAGVVFSTTGALPTGVTAGTTYYAKSTASGTFNLYDTAAHAIAGGSTGIVNTSGSQSGTHTAKGAYYLGLSDKSRWTTGGTERIYNGIVAWNTARGAAGVGANDTEVCEIGEAFTEALSATVIPNLPCASIRIETKVNGARSSGFHNGATGFGYMIKNSTHAIQPATFNTTIDGIEIYITGGSVALYVATLTKAINNIVRGNNGLTTQRGAYITGSSTAGVELTNNIFHDIGGTGVDVAASSGVLAKVNNNLVVRCVTGFRAEISSLGWFYNNISVGNTTNWGSRPSSAYGAGNNFGTSADKKTITADPSTNKITLTSHGLVANTKVKFTTTGALPAPLVVGTTYYARDIATNTFTVATAANGTAIDITDTGTGTHSLTYVWDTTNTEAYIDMTTPDSVFVDYDGNDFRAASAAVGFVNGGLAVFEGFAFDALGAVRPNYESASYPDNLWDAGPFEYDHGEGLAPLSVPISITGMASGSEFAVYKASDMSEIVAPTSTTGSYTGTYTYTGDTNIIVRVRKGSAAIKYLPYEYAGTITSTGFALVVSQIVDTIA